MLAFMPFGKYKGKEIREIEDTDYLRWFLAILEPERFPPGVTLRKALIAELQERDRVAREETFSVAR